MGLFDRQPTQSFFQDPFGLKSFIQENPRFDIGAQINALGEISKGRLGIPEDFSLRGILKAPDLGGVTPTASAADTGDIGVQQPTTDTSGLGGNIEGIIGGDFGDGAGDGGFDIGGFISELDAQADRAADELISIASGNRDFAIRQLDAEHKVALGNNDQERAAFLEKVADKLEQKIGTIAYDFDRDIGRLAENKERALFRLGEEEKAIRGGLTRQAESGRELQEVSLSERGLLSAPRERAIGLATKDVGELESEINAKFEAFERAVSEQEQDITRTAERGVQDVTTGARRQAGAGQRAFEFGKEAAEKQFDAERRRAELERERAKRLSAGLAIPPA